jgi:hypothetical protein
MRDGLSSSPPRRYVFAVSLALAALLVAVEDEASSCSLAALPLLCTGSAADAAAAPEAPAWAHYADPATLPLLHAGASTDQPMLVHEREADIAGFLYAESGRAFIVDAAGPVCMPRLFFAVSGVADGDARHRMTRLAVEVDGAVALDEAFADLFFAPPAPAGEPWGGLTSLPQPLTFSIEHNVSLRSGLNMQAPICASARLRVALDFSASFPGSSAEALLADGSRCVARGEPCKQPFYINAQLLRYPARIMPKWRPFSNTSAAPLAQPQTATWSADRLIGEAELRSRAGRAAGTFERKCADLSDAEREFVAYSHRGTSGVISLLTLDFPDLPWLLHSRGVRIVARFDGGRGRLDVDLEALLGPEFLVSPETPSARKGLFLVGEREGAGGLYIALPMPWWSSVDIRIVLDPEIVKEDAAGPSLLQGFGADLPAAHELPPRRRVCTTVALMERGEAARLLSRSERSSVASGYLQGGTLDVQRALGTTAGRSRDDHVLADIVGVRGALVLLSVYMFMSKANLVEGDIRAWADGAATPALWSTGFEDLFGGSHFYKHAPHRSEALFAWDRSAISENDVHCFQMRTFMLDKLHFRQSLRVTIEQTVFSPWPMHGRAAALFYGLPAGGGASGAAAVADELFVGDAGSRSTHDYELTAAEGAVATYNLSSVLPSEGEFDSQRISLQGIYAIRAAAPAGDGGAGSAVSFTLRVPADAQLVELRRLVDVRYSVQRAAIFVDGLFALDWLSTDRHYDHLDTHWREEVRVLPPHLTNGKSLLRLLVEVITDELGLLGSRSYIPTSLGDAWTEARWRAVCYPFPAPR